LHLHPPLTLVQLPYRVRWQDLKDLFRRAGSVLRADVALGPDNRSRGYGTVLLASAEDAGRAIDMFNGYSWQTRVLEVRPDRVGADLGPEGSGMGGAGVGVGVGAGVGVGVGVGVGGAMGVGGVGQNVGMGAGAGSGMGGAGTPMGGIGAHLAGLGSGLGGLGTPLGGLGTPLNGLGTPLGVHGLGDVHGAPGSRPGSSASGLGPAPGPASRTLFVGNVSFSSPFSPEVFLVVACAVLRFFFWTRLSFSFSFWNCCIYASSPFFSLDYANVSADVCVCRLQLPFHTQWQDLKDLFRQAGVILRADVALGQDGRSRGFGMVSFATEADAERAVRMFNG
jgi:RNA recognition motif-containing protein